MFQDHTTSCNIFQLVFYHRWINIAKRIYTVRQIHVVYYPLDKYVYPEFGNHMKLTEILLEAISQKSVKLSHADEISKLDNDTSFSKLSSEELNQLGTKNYVKREDWPRFRKFMLHRSLARNPSTNPELTAYTPGETWQLFNHPEIKSWHQKIISYKIPDSYDTMVLVPCAATKPWKNATAGKLYPSYNKLSKEYGNLYFVTISEPLGIVPMELWDEFPQYDNPGLFDDPVQRSGLFTSDWKRLFGVDSRLQTPFDGALQKKCINHLSGIISKFISHNQRPNLNVVSFVDDSKVKTTHGAMLNDVPEVNPLNRFTKRANPRETPYQHIKDRLKLDNGVNNETN